jgi:hypothetical protein
VGRGFALFDVEELHMMLSRDEVSSVLIYEIVDCCKFLLVPVGSSILRHCREVDEG